MDPRDLYGQFKPTLDSALAFLESDAAGDGQAAEGRFGAASWGRLKILWGALRQGLMERPAGVEALTDLKAEPEDADTRAALMAQVRKVIAADTELQTLVADALRSGVLDAAATSQPEAKRLVALKGNGAVAVGGSVFGNVSIANLAIPREMAEWLKTLLPPEINPAERASIAEGYLRFIDERYRYLEFKGMGLNVSLPLRMPLLELYVPLKARRTLPEGDAWSDELRVAGRRLGDEERAALFENWRGGLGEPEPILDLLAAQDGLMILGDPGSGKSTLLKLLALTLATGQGAVLGLKGYLPFLIPLSAYAEALEAGRCTLTDFIIAHLKGLSVGRRLDLLLEPTLEQGRALFLLDGLDEVRDAGQRNRVVEEVKDFYTDQRGRGNRFVLTSRIVGYAEVRPCAEGLGECTLVDFQDEEIDAFVTRWTAAVERQARGDGEQAAYDAAVEREGLLRAIHHNPGARRLAANPLLLTILAVMKRQGRELPEERVLLYEAYIKSLLSDWHRVRSLSRRSLERLSLLAPDPHARRPERMLEDVALWMQETAPGKGLVTEGALRQRLTQAYAESPDCEARVDDFMDQMRGHAGLLVDRGGGRFGFIHLTFMEYLAGRALARQYLDPKLGPEVVVTTLAEHLAEPDWRETALLCLGALSKSHGSPEGAARVIEGLLGREPAAAGEAALLSGLSLADLGADGVTADCYEGTRDRLLKTMRALEGIPARTRILCGEALAEIGDPRPEVMTLDAMQFCWVPAGDFFLGSPEDDPDARDAEKEGAGLYRLEYDYWMARHPVTVAQFAEYQAAAISGLERTRQVGSSATAPVVRVSWTEAVAFCRWLSQRWLDAGLIPQGWSVGLPSEAEWEKAARGGLQILEKTVVRSLPEPKGPRCELVANAVPRRCWPWDDAFDPDASHYLAHDLYRPSPAGCFPRGVSPYGCEDMSGNVWEWTRSIFGAYPYPAGGRARAEREPSDGSAPRVLRGGAFYYGPRFVRCAFRYYYAPDDRLDDGGFRVVLSPFPLDSEPSDL